jgi:D-alanine-D-alanine ligase
VTHVVVLAGGLSPERDVSLRSGRRVAEALRDCDLDVTVLDVDGSLLPTLRALSPDCVVPLLHGAAGEDGAIRNILQSLGISYVGSDGRACGLAFDKPVAKTILAGVGIHTPAFMALPQAVFRELGASAVLEAVVTEIPLPLVIKPTKGGSALGTMIVRDPAQLPSAMMSAFAYGDIVMIEQLVTGVECAISVLQLGPCEVLPPVEIVAPDSFYDYHARYVAGTTEFFVPARLNAADLNSVRELGLTVHTTLGLRDWSRTDCIIDDAGTPWFLDVNVAPGMTETSLYPQSLAAANRDLGQTVAALIAQATERS